MTVYANTTLPEVEELVQGAKIAAIHEECGALFVEMAAWEDEDGKAQLRMEYHDNPGPATCNNGVVGE